jgi:hypothetical protein
MSSNGHWPGSPDLSKYHQNRRKFPLEELAKYAGQHVAFSPDGTRILASGADLDELDNKLTAAGIPISQVVHAFIDPLDGD